MGPIKRSNAADFSPALIPDEASKRRRLLSTSSPSVAAASLWSQAAPDNYSHSQGNSLEDILWSDDYETHDASRVAATLAEYQAVLGNTDSATPDQEYRPSQSNLLEDFLWSDDYETHDASRVAATLAEYEAILWNTDLASPAVVQDQTGNDATSNAEQRSESNPYHYLTSEQLQSISNIFKSQAEKSNASIAVEFGVTRKAIWKLR